MINYFPRDYEDRSKTKKIEDLQDGEQALIKAICVSRLSNIRIKNGKTMQKLIIRDDTRTCQITWFNQPYLKDKFYLGQTYYFYGRASVKFSKIDINSPVFDSIEKKKNTGKIVPIYCLTNGLTQNAIRSIIENGLKEAGEQEETLPDTIIKQKQLLELNTAIDQIHFPDDFFKFKEARKRLVFEELFSMQLALLSIKNEYNQEKNGIKFPKEVKMSDVIYNLPFNLTRAQLKVLEEIDCDMENQKPMNRLLQGDVGSRKDNS